MCGVAGAIGFNCVSESTAREVLAISSALIHRGPDAFGTMNDNNVVLAHRRLSIIDIDSRSDQPMFDENRDIALVFNGEIYNHVELRKELEVDYTFKTDHSDTEIIIYAYKKWGMKCLERFVGMFAFVLYDKLNTKVFLCRDRLGKKPLFYAQTDGIMYFSSEANALFAAASIQKEVNDEAVYDYLSCLTINAPSTFFKNVLKLPAGSYLEINLTGQFLHKYWDVNEFLNEVKNDSEIDAVTQTKTLLEQSMYYRNVSDVPIAIALSGGLDSALNLVYSNQLSTNKLLAINVAYKDSSEFDESAIAKKLAEGIGIDFVSIRIDQKDFEDWIRLYLHCQKDMPIGDPNSPLLYGISKTAAAHGCKVIQVGEGGDEIGGYPVYRRLDWLERIARFVPPPVFRAISALPMSRKIKKEFEVLSEGGPISRRFLFGFTDVEKKRFWLKDPQRSTLPKLALLASDIDKNLPDSFLRRLLSIEYKFRLAELLLPRVDYPSMAASVEARSPFMDHKLIQYSASLPFSIKLKDGPKSLLRKIAKNVLPSYLLNNKKVGFGMLLTPFLENELPHWYEKEITSKDSPLKKYIKESYLRDLLISHRKTKKEGYRLWILYSLNMWLQHHNL